MLILIYTLLLILSFIMVILIMSQPSNQETLTSAFTGGSNLFKENKVRGVQKTLKKYTLITAFIIAIIGLVSQLIL